MANRAGLKKVTKTVKGKKGSVVRTYWVKTKEGAKAAGRFINKHKGKIAGAAALTAAAALAYKHRGSLNREGLKKAGDAVKGAAESVKTAHAAGKSRADKFRRAASHPDRVAQGKSTGRARVAYETAKGYVQGVRRSAPGQAASKSVNDSTAGARTVAGYAGEAAKRGASAVAGAVRGAAGSVRRAGKRASNRARGRSNDTTLARVG